MKKGSFESSAWVAFLLIFFDIATYSLAVPFFPSLFIETLGSEKGSIFWGIAQSCGCAVGVINGFLSGVLSDNLGRKFPIVLNQALGFGALVSLAVASGEKQARSFSAYLLLFGYIFRKGNRTIPVVMAYLVDGTSTNEQLRELLPRTHSVLGFAFGVGPLISSLLLSNLGVPNSSIFALGACFVFINVVMAVYQLPASPIVSGKTRRAKAITCSSMKESIFKNKVVYFIHFAGSIGQQCYIATFGIVARDRFLIKGARYGYIISYFGLAYAFSSAYVVPILSKHLKPRTLLSSGLLFVSIARWLLGVVSTINMLLVCHAAVAIGSAAFTYVVSLELNRLEKGSSVAQKSYGGAKNGAADSVSKFAGVIAPMITLPLHYYYYSDTAVSPGAAIASTFYFLAFLASVLLPLGNYNGSLQKKTPPGKMGSKKSL